MIIETIMQIIDIACIVFTIIGCIMVATKDSLKGWYFYFVASILGIIFFFYPFNPRILIWITFFIANILAIKRKKKEMKSPSELWEEKRKKVLRTKLP